VDEKIFQLVVKNAAGVEIPGWSFQFPTIEAGQAWAAGKIASGVWGHEAQWQELDQADPRIPTATESRQVTDPNSGRVYTEYHLPAEFSVEFKDVTAVGKQDRDIALRRQKQDVGANVMALVAVLNDSKNYGLAEFQAMLADPTLGVIKELLYAGGLDAAKQMIQVVSNQYFTDADKAKLVKLIDDSGLAS
jgi:hypothetical protein